MKRPSSVWIFLMCVCTIIIIIIIAFHMAMTILFLFHLVELLSIEQYPLSCSDPD